MNEKNKILIVDDSKFNREILKSIFNEQFQLIEAEDGQQALECLAQHSNDFSLVLLDIMMPKKNGLEVLEEMNAQGLLTRIPVIVITGEATPENDLKAYEYGAADIIYKPFSRAVVIRRCFNIMEQYESRNHMEQLLAERTKELRAYQEKLKRNNEFLTNALSSVVEFRSLESAQHVQRVKEFTAIMLETWMTLHPETIFTQNDIEQITNAAALHDIGKIAIPDEILLKPGKLTKEEFETMKAHTTIGCEILENFKQEDNDFYHYCYDICRYHHERADGRGYPDGLTEKDIPLWAQIVAVVDVYDALISPRVYKDPYSITKATHMIQDGECGTFSTDLLQCFNQALPAIQAKTNLLS